MFLKTEAEKYYSI